MKNKIIKNLFALVLCFTLAIPLVACGSSYHSKAGKMDEVAGTYKLTTYQKKNANDEKYDALATEEITAYLVIGKNGNGYYAYKDKTTALVCDSTIVEYTYDIDNADLIKSIKYNDGRGTDYIWEQRPGCGSEPLMGFDVNNHTLNYTISKHQYSSHTAEYSYAEYTRISTDTNLTKVRTELGKDTTTLPEPTKFMLKNLAQFMYFDYNSSSKPNNTFYSPTPEEQIIKDNMTYSKYEYIVIDLNSIDSNNQFDVYYKEGGTAKTAKGSVTFHEIPADFDAGFIGAEFSILGTTYSLSVISKTPGTSLAYSLWTAPDQNGTSTQIYSEMFSKYSGSLTSATDIGDYYTKPVA